MYSIIQLGSQIYLFVHKIAFNNKFIAAIYWAALSLALFVITGLIISFTGNVMLGILFSLLPSATMIFFAYDLVAAFRGFFRRWF